MSEIANLFNLDDATLRDMADVEEDVNVKGKYFLELAHRAMPRGEEAQIDYEVWLKKAIECGNEEAKGEYEEFSLRKENSKEKNDAAIRERIQEIRAMTQAQTSELVQKEEMAAIYVFCERVVSRKLVTSGDLDNISGKMRKMSDQMSRNPENMVPYDLMGDLYYKIGSMYEQKGNIEKAVINYGNATEYGNLDAMRVLRSGKLGNENREKFAENAAAIGNAEDKFVNLKTALMGGRYEEADTKIVEMLKASGKSMNDLYQWAGEVLKCDYTDGAITIYEHIMDSAEEGTSCLQLALWMYNALNGAEPDELWEIAQGFIQEGKEGLIDALSLYLNFSLKQNDNDKNGIRAVPKDITPNGIDIWIYNTQLENGIPNGNCEIKSFKGLTLREITSDQVMDTYGNKAFIWRAEVEMNNGEIKNVFEMWDNKGKTVAPDFSDCILRHGLRYTDDLGSFIMKLDDPEKVLKCTVTGIKNEGEDAVAEKCTVYKGGIEDELEQGAGTKYIFSNINTNLLAPVRLMKELEEIPFDEKYEGNFKSGKYWGQGKKELKDGRIWEGTFVAGEVNGIAHWHGESGKISGIFLFENGITIEGCRLEIVETNPDGSKKGNLYKGQYGKGSPLGKGIYLRFDNLPDEMANIEYAAEHFHDIPFTWKSEGQFNGRYAMDGEGEKTNANNGKWIYQWKGTFRNGALEGYGQWKNNAGWFSRGQWRGGCFVQGIKLMKDKQREWDLLDGNFTSVDDSSCIFGQGKCYHFSTVPDDVYSDDIEKKDLDELPYTWRFSGEFDKGKLDGYGKLAFKEDNGEIRYEGRLLRTDSGRFVAIDMDHSWKEMDAAFHDLNGKGCRVDVTCLCNDDTVDGYYYAGDLANGIQEGEGLSGRFTQKKVGEITYDALAGKEMKPSDFDDLYEGQFVNGEASGRGKLTDRSGNCWTGDFSRRLPNGQCSFTGSAEYEDDFCARNHIEYTGQFKNGKEDGMGCLVRWEEHYDHPFEEIKPGFAAIGEFVNGVFRSGKKKQFSDIKNKDAVYVRDHFDELFCMEITEGTFNSDLQLDGFGKKVILDKYLIWEQTGKFNKGKLNGEGECCLYTDSSLSNNDQYLDDLEAYSKIWGFKGNLKDGKPHQSGTLTIPVASEWYKPLNACLRRPANSGNPIVLTLEGFSGELEVKCGITKLEKMILPNGDQYSGETDSLLRPAGSGMMNYADQIDLCYIGSFSEGKRHGTGKLLHGKKTVYEGEWREDHITDKIHFSQKKYKDFL